MLIEAAELKRGMCVIVEGFPCVVVDSSRVKYGKGPVFVHAELRDVLSDVPRKAAFHLMKRLEQRELVVRWMRYHQSIDGSHVFSDSGTGEQVTVPNEFIGNDAQWLKEDHLWKLVYLDGELFAALPMFRS